MSNSKIDISSTYLLKSILILIGILAIVILGSDLILPLVVAAIIAILLDKPVQKMKSWGVPNWLSITLSLVLMLVIFALLSWLISSQVSNIAGDWPTIEKKASEKLSVLSAWSKDTLNYDYNDLVGSDDELLSKIESVAKVVFFSLMNLLSQSLVIFVYIVLLLMQKKMFMNFFKKLVSSSAAMGTILSESSSIITSYLFGKSKIMLFLFAIYYLGFTLGSVPYALFLALFAALFSIIPYVGNLIGGGIAVVLSYLYAGGVPAIIVIGVIALAQLVENYILTPWIIGDETDLNPFITVFGIIILSSIWGTVGAIIALPVFGVLKVIFDHTNGMEAYAYFLKKSE